MAFHLNYLGVIDIVIILFIQWLLVMLCGIYFFWWWGLNADLLLRLTMISNYNEIHISRWSLSALCLSLYRNQPERMIICKKKDGVIEYLCDKKRTKKEDDKKDVFVLSQWEVL
jgi:hypothetical protein